jgi:hypothetical protein
MKQKKKRLIFLVVVITIVVLMTMPTGVSLAAEVDANGPYGTPEHPICTGEAIAFEADIINGDANNYYFRWDVDNDGFWEFDNLGGIKGISDYTHQFDVEYIGLAVVESWDGVSVKYEGGILVPDTLRDTADVYVVDCPVRMLEELVKSIQSFDPDDFSNPNRQNALVNKIEAILNNIDMNDLESICAAIDKLETDILPKTDGERPPPDWVTDPDAQQELEDAILKLLEALYERAEELGGCGG